METEFTPEKNLEVPPNSLADDTEEEEFPDISTIDINAPIDSLNIEAIDTDEFNDSEIIVRRHSENSNAWTDSHVRYNYNESHEATAEICLTPPIPPPRHRTLQNETYNITKIDEMIDRNPTAPVLPKSDLMQPSDSTGNIDKYKKYSYTTMGLKNNSNTKQDNQTKDEEWTDWERPGDPPSKLKNFIPKILKSVIKKERTPKDDKSIKKQNEQTQKQIDKAKMRLTD